MNNEKLILVYYISINNIDPTNIEYYFNELTQRISSESISDNSEIIFIPIHGQTRIECINPKYITNGDLIKKHERLMSELHEHLEYQTTQINKINNANGK